MSEASDAVSPQNRREPGAVRDGGWKGKSWQGLAAAMLLLQAGTAHAQAPEQERLLSTEEEAVLGEITVTATRDERSVLDVPQTVDVITKKEIEERVARDIQDLVRYTPGVSVPRQTSGANPFGQLTGFQVRGVSGNRVQILVDGSRVQEITTDGSRDFVDPFNLKAVEVVRGPNSVLWGSDALGGVVNFRTRDPEDLLADAGKPWAVEVRGAYDSFDRSWRSQITGAVEHGDIQMLASLGYLGASEPELGRARADGGIYGCPRFDILPCNVLYPSDTDAYNGLFKIVWTPTQEHKFKATGEFFDRNSTVDQVFDFSANSTAGSAFFYTNEDWQRDLDMTRTRLSFEHEWTVDQPWLDSVKWSLSHSPQRRLTESRQERFYSRVARPRIQIVEQLRDYGETFTELDVVAQSSFDLAASSHTLIYGFDGDWTNTEYDGVNTTFRSDTGATTVVGNQGFNFPQVETRRADVFVQDEIKLFDERLTLTPGLRYSTYRLDPTADEDYVGLPGFEPGVVSQDKITKKLGAVFKLDETYSLYGSYGEGFKVPTSQQLFVSVQDPFSFPPVNVIPNPNLKPESVRSYEAGVRGEWNTAYFSAGVFYADYENFIRGLVTVNPADPNTVTSDNVSDVKLWGIEASAEAELWRNLVGTASLSYQRGTQRLTADAEETAFDGAVPFTAVLGLRYLLPDWNLETEVIGTFASGVTRRADPDAFKPDGYAVFDAFVHWKPGKGFELDAGVQNIFDKRYFPNTLSGYSQTVTSAVANVNPIELQTAPGRTFKLGITQRF